MKKDLEPGMKRILNRAWNRVLTQGYSIDWPSPDYERYYIDCCAE